MHARFQHKIDIEANWSKATFAPLSGELIIYAPDENYSYPRFKVGDGTTSVPNLPFSSQTLMVEIEKTQNTENEYHFKDQNMNFDIIKNNLPNVMLKETTGFDAYYIPTENWEEDGQITFSHTTYGWIYDIELLDNNSMLRYTRELATKEYVDNKMPPVSKGAGTSSLQFADGVANGDYSIAGGTNRKEVVEGIVGSTVANKINLSNPTANGDVSLAYGAGSTAHSAGSRAYGTSSQAGYLGYYFWDINFDTNVITLSTNQKQILTSRKKPASTVLAGWNIGDTISIVNNSPYPMCSKITAIDTNNGTITVDSLPFTSIDDPLVKAPNDRAVIAIPPVQQDSILGQEFDTTRPIGVGEVEIGFGATADGFDNIAAGPVSSAHGFRNTALDTASFVTGRENIGAWGALVGGYKNEVLGDTASATGRSNIVSGSNATANGASNKAIGRNSHAEGLYTISAGERSHSEGYGTNQLETIPTTAEEAITTFETTKFSMALGAQSHAEGRDTLALKDGSHSEGRETISNGLQSHAEGYRSQALANTSHAEGSGTKATGVGSHSEGMSTEAKGKCSHAEGMGTIASGEAQHVSGKYNRQNEEALFIIGDGTSDTDRRNVMSVNHKGLQVYGLNKNDDNYSANYVNNTITLTESTEDAGSESMVSKTQIMPDLIEAANCDPSSLYTGTILTGQGIKFYEEIGFIDDPETGKDPYTEQEVEILTKKDVSKLHSLPTEFIGRPGEGENAEVFNGSSKALGARSHAEGASTIAYGNFSHTEGQQTITGDANIDSSLSGLAAHAEGMFTQASGNRSHAEGNRTIAYGTDSHAEGIKTATLGKYSHAEGQSSNAPLGSPRAADNVQILVTPESTNDEIHNAWKTTKFSLAKGEASHVEGLNNLALGSKSHVEGSNNIASADYQHVEGRFNAKDDSAVHILGWGNSESNRKNIHTIDKSGNAYFAGEIDANGLSINGANGVDYTLTADMKSIKINSIEPDVEQEIIKATLINNEGIENSSKATGNFEELGEEIWSFKLGHQQLQMRHYKEYEDEEELIITPQQGIILKTNVGEMGDYNNKPLEKVKITPSGDASFDGTVTGGEGRFNYVVSAVGHFTHSIVIGENYEEVALKSDIQKYIDEAILGGAW